MGYLILSIIGGAIGWIIGAFIVERINRKRSCGVIRVDFSDPVDGPYLFLEASVGINQLMKNKYVVFEVKNESYISQ